MKEERQRILSLLSEGKISPEEADALLEALAQGEPAKRDVLEIRPAQNPKYLRVMVDGQEEDRPNKVNVRIPLDLIRAGMRLAALLPAVAYEPVNRALKEHGLDLDVSRIKPENLEDLVAHLRELSVDVVNGNETTRVFCE